MKFRSTNPGRGAPNPGREAWMGIGKCSPSRAVPKRGTVGKVCVESNIEVTTRTKEHQLELRSFHPKLRSTEMGVYSVK